MRTASQKIVRDSKFRHVFPEAFKETFLDVRPASKTTESVGLRVNSKYMAFPYESGGGGSLAVFPIEKHGRVSRDQPLITGHSGPILDFEFSPFNDSLLLTCAEDMKVMLWQVPEGGLKEHLKEPVATLEGHTKKVSFSTFNPIANNICASAAFDYTVRIWNLEEQAEAFKIETPEQVTHLKWNMMGSLLAATCKDKSLKILDPRASKIVSGCKIHQGVKPSKVEFIGSTSVTDECNKIVTTGFNKSAQREMRMYDIRKLPSDDTESAEALVDLELDQGTGSLMPFFDVNTQLLFLAGKGDSNIRYFEVTQEDPYMHFIDNKSINSIPQKAFAFQPKHCVDVMKHEIMRGYKLESSTVVPISFRVPRKSELFQEDLFPDCLANEPSVSTDNWMASSADDAKLPGLMSMKPGADANRSNKKQETTSVLSVKDLKKMLAEKDQRIAGLEKENAELKTELSKLKGE